VEVGRVTSWKVQSDNMFYCLRAEVAWSSGWDMCPWFTTYSPEVVCSLHNSQNKKNSSHELVNFASLPLICVILRLARVLHFSCYATCPLLQSFCHSDRKSHHRPLSK
jgi:hypothetical protein